MITPRGNRLGSGLGGTLVHPGSPPTAGLPQTRRDPRFSGGRVNPTTSTLRPGTRPPAPPDPERAGIDADASCSSPGPGPPIPIGVRSTDRTQSLSPARRCRRGRYRRIGITQQKATSMLIVVVEEPSRVMAQEPSDAEPRHEGWEARPLSPGDLTTLATPSTHGVTPDRHKSMSACPGSCQASVTKNDPG